MTLKLSVYAVALLLTAALHAQSVLGTWQGTLPIAENPRTVVRITAAPNNTLRGAFFRIDQSGSSIPFASITFTPPNLSFEVPLVDTSFEGKLAADGKSISGTWTQNKHAYPLTLLATTPETVWKTEAPVPLEPMAPTAAPAFEVASVRPSAPNTPTRINTRTRNFSCRGMTVANLITLAYNVRSRQIAGGPAWINEIDYDINATPDTPGQPSLDQTRLMVRKLLAERFGLVIRTEQREFPVYALRVLKAPPRLIPTDPQAQTPGRVLLKEGPDGQILTSMVSMRMPEFAALLMNSIKDRQIVDETGLPEPYDFSLTLPPGTLQGGDNDPASAISYALEAQLGLKLDSRKAMLPVLIVEKAEKPAAN